MDDVSSPWLSCIGVVLQPLKLARGPEIALRLHLLPKVILLCAPHLLAFLDSGAQPSPFLQVPKLECRAPRQCNGNSDEPGAEREEPGEVENDAGNAADDANPVKDESPPRRLARLMVLRMGTPIR